MEEFDRYMTKGRSWGDFAQHKGTQKIFSGQTGNVIKLREHYAHTGVGFPQINADWCADTQIFA